MAEIIELLHFTIRTLEEQQENPDPCFINNAKKVLQPTLKWARDVQRHKRHHSMPITNTQSHSQPLPTNVHGYLYRQK